ncbi:MAG: 4-hydroxy-tetrahydrodipicolinate synthase [Spirochaetaceae bacterium]|jgi:4-hydroxy-tetrahydrodipicolinate synthase|nr:4-hydroxy-tetrahydrodipicolinate synthase [Spirochaetaceae bacterium]
MLKLRGAWTALVTPMKQSGEIDVENWRELIRRQIAAGIDGIVPIGTTGETPTLDEAEEEELIRIAVNEAAGQVPVMVGTGSNSTKHATAYCERAKRLGADMALVVTPYYNKPNDSGLIRHFEAVGEIGLPIVIYNIAGRTGRNIPTALMMKLAEIPAVVGVKEASGDINQMGEVLRLVRAQRRAQGKDFAVLSGDDGLTLPLMALGGDGVISVISNLVPDRVAALTNAALKGDFEAARAIHFELLPFIHAAFIETNPVPIKYALNFAGFSAGPCRLPLGELSAENRRVIEHEIRMLGMVA